MHENARSPLDQNANFRPTKLLNSVHPNAGVSSQLSSEIHPKTMMETKA